MRLYAHVMPVCSIDAPVVSGVVLKLWPSVIANVLINYCKIVS